MTKQNEENTFKKIIENMSEEDRELYYKILNEYQNQTSEIVESILSKLDTDDKIISFVKNINESLGDVQ
jgi:hypothetical protein